VAVIVAVVVMMAPGAIAFVFPHVYDAGGLSPRDVRAETGVTFVVRE
jgi:hypothetical protein